MRNDALTPDVVDIDTLLGISKSEAMDRFGWDEKTYDRVCKDADGVASARANRERQLGITIPAVVHLGTRNGVKLDKHVASGLVLPKRSGPTLARLKNPFGRY